MQELSKSLNHGGRRCGRSPAIVTGIVAAIAFTQGAAAEMITTLFERNNGTSNGGAVYFDITVGSNPIEITGFDTNTVDVVPSFGWSVYTTPGTSVGVQTDASAWTLVATGSGIGLGVDMPSPVALDSSFVLAANTSFGMALVIGPEAGHDYSGSGSDPAPGLLQYSNADVTLDLGSAMNDPFGEGRSVFSPRIWNGTIHYNVIPAPGSAAAFAGLGLLAAHRRRRDRRRTETSSR